MYAKKSSSFALAGGCGLPPPPPGDSNVPHGLPPMPPTQTHTTPPPSPNHIFSIPSPFFLAIIFPPPESSVFILSLLFFPFTSLYYRYVIFLHHPRSTQDRRGFMQLHHAHQHYPLWNLFIPTPHFAYSPSILVPHCDLLRHRRLINLRLLPFLTTEHHNVIFSFALHNNIGLFSD